MATRLEYVGNFVELGYDDHPSAPSLVALRGRRGQQDKDQVVAYLRSGTTLVYSPGRDEDVLCHTKCSGSASIATDGVYAWPRTLAYYVQAYDVELPAAFEEHMKREDWVAPTDLDKGAFELPRYTQ